MTTLETIAGGCILAILSALLGSFIGGKNKATKEELENHEKSPTPHPVLPCEVHRVQLGVMDRKLDRIMDKLDIV